MNARSTELVGYFLDEDKGDFLVLAGGKVSDNSTNSFLKRSDYQKRLAYEQDGTIQDGVLVKPIVFPSVSAAASILGGASMNGKAAWKRVGE